METSTVRLRALRGRPLDDPKVRSTVEATARAVLERTGVGLTAIESDGSSVTVTLAADRLAAMGFLAELRRLTNTWYQNKYHAGELWGSPPPGDDDAPPAASEES